MSCRNRGVRCLFRQLARAREDPSGCPGRGGGHPGISSSHVENGGCGGHLGCRQTAGGRPGSVATGCAVASSPEEVRSSPSPTAALPLQQRRAVRVPPWLRRAVRAAGSTAIAAAALSVTGAGPALAQTPPSLNQVLDAATAWLVGLLASLATLFLTVGGVRYMAGATDPGEVEKAKAALKAAAVGYALAVLAPLAVKILKQIVGV